MAASFYEPSSTEIRLTLALGLTILSPYYAGFARSLNLRGDERLLDFGSGSGVCSRHIAAHLRRGRLDCVDISHGWMGVIRKTLRSYRNVYYHLGHITDLDLPESAFDAVVVHFVLHDISASERPVVVNALARRLKPGGRLVLREPQGEGLEDQELKGLMMGASLAESRFENHKIMIGRVFDGVFMR
jgi:ubiquinone/menaquinone biosynthesis C-methylase UbiE